MPQTYILLLRYRRKVLAVEVCVSRAPPSPSALRLTHLARLHEYEVSVPLTARHARLPIWARCELTLHHWRAATLVHLQPPRSCPLARGENPWLHSHRPLRTRMLPSHACRSQVCRSTRQPSHNEGRVRTGMASRPSSVRSQSAQRLSLPRLRTSIPARDTRIPRGA